MTIHEAGPLRVVVMADGENRLAGVLDFQSQATVPEPERDVHAGQHPGKDGEP